jgi:alkylation response protein AidB-like acyl-CoA dehydrogenase
LDQTISYIKKRVQFGYPIGWFQETRYRISDLATLVEAARSLSYRACSNFDMGEKNNRLADMASLFAGETASRVTHQALQLYGGYGFIKDMDIEKFYRDAHTLELWQWKKDLSRVTIANRVIGKL